MVKQPLVCYVLGSWLLAIATAATYGMDPPKAVFSAEQLRARLLEAQGQIHSVYVVYRSAAGSYDDSEFPPGTYLYRIVAAKSPSSWHHVSAHGHDRLKWQDDPLQQRCYVTANHWYNVNPVNRTYSEGTLRPNEELPGTMPREFFFLATGLWPVDQRPPPRFEGRPIVLREIAANANYKVVRPQQELIEGHWCHVLEHPGIDCLWIDTQRGFSLLAREVYGEKDGGLIQRFELEGHQEAAPGIWLPTRIRNIAYDYLARTAEGRKRLVKNTVTEMLEVKANQVEDSIFTFQPPPGSLLIASFTEDPKQAQPGGLDQLDYVVRWLQENAPTRPVESPSSLGYFAGLPALLIILVWEITLRWRRRRAPSV